MRARTILVAALLAGVSVACSKPAPSSGAASPTDDREIRLVDAPSADSAVVSALEAGRGATLSQSPRASTKRRTAISSSAPEPGAELAVPSLAVTEMAAPATLIPVTTSVPLRTAATGVPAPTSEAGPTTSAGSGPAMPAGGRGPVILIRGGMGTPHDDCKLHPVASRGAGIAINNVAPPIPGRFAVNNRLQGGNGGFTRIR